MMMEVKAKEHPEVKFLKIVGSKCIPGFKDANCPSLIIYKDGELFKQIIPASPFLGGLRMNLISKYFLLFFKNIHTGIISRTLTDFVSLRMGPGWGGSDRDLAKRRPVEDLGEAKDINEKREVG